MQAVVARNISFDARPIDDEIVVSKSEGLAEINVLIYLGDRKRQDQA